MAHCFAAAIVRYLLYATVCAVTTTSLLQAGNLPPATIRVANDAMERWPDGHLGGNATPTVWGFELGILLAGVGLLLNIARPGTRLQVVRPPNVETAEDRDRRRRDRRSRRASAGGSRRTAS